MKLAYIIPVLALLSVASFSEAPIATPDDQFFWSDPNPVGAVSSMTIFARSGTNVVARQSVRGTNTLDCLTLLTNQPAGSYTIQGTANGTNGLSSLNSAGFGVAWQPVPPPPAPVLPPTQINVQKKTPPGLAKKAGKR